MADKTITLTEGGTYTATVEDSSGTYETSETSSSAQYVVSKKVIIHPYNADGSLDTSTNIYPKTNTDQVDGLSTALSTLATTSELTNETTRAETAEAGLSTRVTSIENKIPSDASSSNQLADKTFVNSSIASQTANFLGTLDANTDLGLTKPASHSNIISALNSYSFASKTNNDYCFVVNLDSNSNTIYERFKYTSSGNTFAYEYTLNNSSFTAVQWSAINSGITSSKVSTYDGYATSKADKATTVSGYGITDAYKIGGSQLDTGVKVIKDLRTGDATAWSNTDYTRFGKDSIAKVAYNGGSTATIYTYTYPSSSGTLVTTNDLGGYAKLGTSSSRANQLFFGTNIFKALGVSSNPAWSVNNSICYLNENGQLTLYSYDSEGTRTRYVAYTLPDITSASAAYTLATTNYVAANPGSTSGTLSSIKIGDTNYAISGSGGSSITGLQDYNGIAVDSSHSSNGNIISTLTSLYGGTIVKGKPKGYANLVMARSNNSSESTTTADVNGIYNIAFGNKVKATGAGCISAGSGTNAGSAVDWSSLSGGTLGSTSVGAIAVGFNTTATTTAATALGRGTTADAEGAVALGYYSHASGSYSIAGCAGTVTAAGEYGVAIGASAYTSGEYAVALGHGTAATIDNMCAVGLWNNVTSVGSSTTLFVVGNGTDANNRSNAFEVCADGTIRLPDFTDSTLSTKNGYKRVAIINGVLTVID